MEQSKSIRSEIEHKEFPRSADGYDREAVDSHLRAVAELLDRHVEGDASWKLSVAMADEVRRIGESAGTRVQEIVDVAERTAGEIVEQAEARASEIVEQAKARASATVERAEGQASATVEAAEESAGTIRRDALEDAERVGEAVEQVAQEARERAHAQTEELRQAMATASTLLERLGSAGALEGELNAVSERITGEAPRAGVAEAHAGEAEEGGERIGPPRSSYRGAAPATERDAAAATEESKPRPVSVWFSKLGQKRDGPTNEETSSNGGPDSLAREVVATEELPGVDDAAPAPSLEADEPVLEEDEPAADEIANAEDRSRQNLETYTAHKMRMAAFNMLVRGSAREDVAAYLRESFELTEADDDLLAATLDEAALQTREWRAVPNPIPRRKRFRGR